MYKYVSLNNTTAAFYENLTYPAFRSRLRALDSDKSIVALGIHLDSQPVGLVLAEYSTVENQKTATILSFFIVPQHRGKALGKTLLTHVENELCQLGCLQVNVVYISNSTTPYWEKILQQCKWSAPQLRMLVCSGSIINIKDAPWLKLANALPSVYTIFPWMELTKQERELIQKQQMVSPWYPEILSPWSEEEIIEPLNSLGLRYQDQVVGWMVTHRIATDTVRYTKLFVREDLQRLGRAISLLSKAIKLQLEAMEDSKAVFVVNAGNTTMLNFVDRRLSPYLNSLSQSWGASKVLDKA
jgi:GNAT superfamily N-acetyltransferase